MYEPLVLSYVHYSLFFLVQVPRLVSLLAESFNAHMRFGSCLAIGISCAGTGSREAMDVLEPMMEDVVDFVRQVNQLTIFKECLFAVCAVFVGTVKN